MAKNEELVSEYLKYNVITWKFYSILLEFVNKYLVITLDDLWNLTNIIHFKQFKIQKS